MLESMTPFRYIVKYEQPQEEQMHVIQGIIFLFWNGFRGILKHLH